LLDAEHTLQWAAQNGPFDAVICAAAQVGGIQANVAAPWDFLQTNLRIDASTFQAATAVGVQRLMYVGSSCMYPRDQETPLRETDLLAAPLEPTNEGYAIAKIAGTRACAYRSQQFGETWRAIVPCNLYGPGDHYSPGRSHLLAAIVHKIATAVRTGETEVEIWGDGEARREFLYVDDLARFMLAALNRLKELPHHLNVGYGTDHTVNEYYRMVADVFGWQGRFEHDLSRPVGMRRKLMDSTLARSLGWAPQTDFVRGITLARDAYLQQERAR
jgi:GDP-L-fucose synthase